MNGTLFIDSLEKLKPFLNNENIIEIVVRQGNKKIKTFQKIALNGFQQPEVKELASKVIKSMNKNNRLVQKNLSLTRQVANLQQLDLVLNGANLAATAVTFAILYEKLNSISAEINQQINQLHQTVKHGYDIQTGFEFNKVLADHTDMLDSRRRKQPYPEDKMRDLVDREFNVLTLLIKAFQKDIAADNEALIVSIFSLLAMFTISLRYFDELYFFNNHDVLGDQEVWHSSHGKWMSIYETLSSEWFVERLQDHGVFNTNMTMREVDIYYSELLNQMRDLREEVEDNQSLILSIGDLELLNALRENSSLQVKESIEEALKEALEGEESPETEKIMDEASKQVALLA